MTDVHLVISLPIREMEDFLDSKAIEWELISSTPYQIGAGFGSRIEVLIVMRRLPVADKDGRLRRKPVPPIPAKKSSGGVLTHNGHTPARA